MKKSSKPARSTAKFHGDVGRPVFPGGSYLYGRLASPAVRKHLSSQQVSPMQRAKEQAANESA